MVTVGGLAASDGALNPEAGPLPEGVDVVTKPDRECLTEVGVEPGKDAETVLAQVEKSGIDARKCFEG